MVDFKSWTFGNPAGWARGLETTYGPLEGPGGFPMMMRLDRSCREIDAVKVTEISRLYGSSHAVLYRASETGYPSVFEGQRYKTVALPDAAQ